MNESIHRDLHAWKTTDKPAARSTSPPAPASGRFSTSSALVRWTRTRAADRSASSSPWTLVGLPASRCRRTVESSPACTANDQTLWTYRGDCEQMRSIIVTLLNNWRRNKMGQDQEHRDSEQARMRLRHNSHNSAKKTTVLRTYFKNGQLQVS